MPISPKCVAKRIKEQATDVKNQLLNLLRGKKHAIIFDDSTHSSTKKALLIVYIRYFFKFNIYNFVCV